MAQEEKKDAAEAKRAPRGGITRRGLFIGVGSTAALLGLGALRYAGHNPLNRPPGGTDEAHLAWILPSQNRKQTIWMRS